MFMKKIILSGFAIAISSLSFAGIVSAQGMMAGNMSESDGHTAREEAEGKIVWDKLEAKQVSCANLSEDDFGVLGEYFMGQKTGASHEAMNNMMVGMMGEEGEEQMHVAMGKRLSGCEMAAVFPVQGENFMPVMNMMMGGINEGSTNPTRNFGFMPYGGFNWILMILWWGLSILGLVTLVKLIMPKSRNISGDEFKS